MAQIRNGIQTPYPPSPVGLLVGLGLTGGAIAGLVMASQWWCVSVPLLIVGILAIANQFGGVTRVRVEHSKLLIEDERLVMGFLVGPVKRRMAWGDYASADIVDGEVVVKDTKGNALHVGKGCPEPELSDLVRRIGDAEKNFREEGV